MIGIGSSVGTGLFIASGTGLAQGGPLALLLGFLIVGFTLFTTMECLCEMAVLFPSSGSFTRYATRFISPAVGFALGWQYWLCWVGVFVVEATTASTIIHDWTGSSSDVVKGVAVTAFISIILLIHCFPVKIFGEVEFVMGAVKIIAIVVLIIVTWVIMGGGGPKGRIHKGEYWADPGALAHGFHGLASVFVYAAFSYGGPEALGILSGEIKHPRLTLPKAIKSLMWSVIILYLTSLLSITFLVAHNNPSLLKGLEYVSVSPFAIAAKEAGIAVLPDIMNAVLLVCVLSVGCVAVYIPSRVLVALSEDGMAWEGFKEIDRAGRPRRAIVFTGLIVGALSYINLTSKGEELLHWFISLSGSAFFLAWNIIIATNFRFHDAMTAQGMGGWVHERFAYRATLWPWLPGAAALTWVVIGGSAIYSSLYPIESVDSTPDWKAFLNNILSLLLFLAMLGGYMLLAGGGLIKLEQVDLVSGRRGEDPEEERLLEKEYEREGLVRRLLNYVHT